MTAYARLIGEMWLDYSDPLVEIFYLCLSSPTTNSMATTSNRTISNECPLLTRFSVEQQMRSLKVWIGESKYGEKANRFVLAFCSTCTKEDL